MSATPNTRRMLSPVGFVLVMLCFLFPFMAVSCQSPVGSISVEYSGNDLVFGGQPTIATSDGQIPQTSDIPPSTPQPLALITYLLTIGGLVGTLIQRGRVRARVAAICGGSAALFLILNEIIVYGNIVTRLAGQSGGQLDPGIGSQSATDAAASLVHTQFGFWLTMVLLLGITTFNVIELRRTHDGAAAKRSPGPAHPLARRPDDDQYGSYDGGPD